MSTILIILVSIGDIIYQLLKDLSPYIVAFITYFAIQVSGVVKKLPGIVVILIASILGIALQFVNLWLNNPDLNPIYAVGLGFVAVFISQVIKQIAPEKIKKDLEKNK